MASTRRFGNIRKLQSGRYQARLWHLGKQVPADRTFPTKAEARAWLATKETELQAGRHLDPSRGREEFGAFAERWLDSRGLRPRTRETYASQLTHILAEFGPVELRAITPSAVRSCRAGYRTRGCIQTPSPRCTRMFRTMLDTAVDDPLLQINPLHIQGAALERSIERPILDWEDVQRVADAIHPRINALVLLGATSGLRFGELTGLFRRHVDLGARTVRVE